VKQTNLVRLRETPWPSSEVWAAQPGWPGRQAPRQSHPAAPPVGQVTISLFRWSAAVDCSGRCNYGRDLSELSAVLRSWRSASARSWCASVAAEHFAFCRDVDWEDPRPLRTYATGLVGGSTWRFWWD
jgi:hypothetical protein